MSDIKTRLVRWVLEIFELNEKKRKFLLKLTPLLLLMRISFYTSLNYSHITSSINRFFVNTTRTTSSFSVVSFTSTSFLKIGRWSKDTSGALIFLIFLTHILFIFPYISNGIRLWMYRILLKF